MLMVTTVPYYFDGHLPQQASWDTQWMTWWYSLLWQRDGPQNYGFQWLAWFGVPPLHNSIPYMGNNYGKTHYFYGPFSIANCYKLPEGIFYTFAGSQLSISETLQRGRLKMGFAYLHCMAMFCWVFLFLIHQRRFPPDRFIYLHPLFTPWGDWAEAWKEGKGGGAGGSRWYLEADGWWEDPGLPRGLWTLDVQVAQCCLGTGDWRKLGAPNFFGMNMQWYW